MGCPESKNFLDTHILIDNYPLGSVASMVVASKYHQLELKGVSQKDFSDTPLKIEKTTLSR